jgi:pilus assembly protein CpaB
MVLISVQSVQLATRNSRSQIGNEEGGSGLAKLSNKSLLAVALVLSLVTVSLVYTFLQSTTSKTVSGDGEIVVVAKTNIPAKIRVSHEMVQELRVPPQYIQPGAMRIVPKAVGTMTREAIITGEQLTERRLLLDGTYAGFSSVIPAGKRAITVATTDVTGVGGLLKAGDYVDVLVTFDEQTVGDFVTKIVMQNIAVLSVNRDSLDNDDGKKDVSKDLVKVANVTLAVSPEDAARITLAEEKGKVRFALRPFITELDTYVAQPVFPANLVGVQQSRKQSDNTSTPATLPAATPVSSSKASGNSNGIPVIRGTKIE